MHASDEILWGVSGIKLSTGDAEVLERLSVNVEIALGTGVVERWLRERKISHYISKKNSRVLYALRAYNALLQNLALYAELDLPMAT